MGDVVAVADEREPNPVQVAEPLAHGQQVGERLARMMLVGERVDHRYARGRRHVFDLALRKRADDDRVAVAGQRARSVGDRLAAAELELVRPEHDRVQAEPRGGGGKGDARARRGLCEIAGDGPPA